MYIMTNITGVLFVAIFFWLRCIANVTEYICAGDGYFQGY